MSDWIKDAVNKARQEKQRRMANEEQNKAHRNNLSVSTNNAFAFLIGAVSKDIESFNEQFPKYPLKSAETKGTVGFQVERQRDPFFHLLVMLNRNEITWAITRESDHRGFQPSGIFQIELPSNGDHYLLDSGKRIRYEEASEKMLLPAVTDTVEISD